MSQYREFVLKNFWDKLKEAKRQNAREVRMSIKELDDIGFVIYELLSQHYANTVNDNSATTKESEEEVTLTGGSFKKKD